MKSTQPKEKAQCKCDYTKYMHSQFMHTGVMDLRESIKELSDKVEVMRVKIENFNRICEELGET